ncbi:hypothetical protein CEXT_586921 [Caerostris extrusa]|uniref:Uncharacterized protein n=1 Tax=Caerostris extrusa TaxID=172846 RepID=A0AAV4VRN7_CAEEX|nr:hypothetical protein CEXT_586921 [Caerostris extrusa]
MIRDCPENCLLIDRLIDNTTTVGILTGCVSITFNKGGGKTWVKTATSSSCKIKLQTLTCILSDHVYKIRYEKIREDTIREDTIREEYDTTRELLFMNGGPRLIDNRTTVGIWTDTSL